MNIIPIKFIINESKLHQHIKYSYIIKNNNYTKLNTILHKENKNKEK